MPLRLKKKVDMWMTRFVIRAQYEKGVKWKKLQRLV